MSRKQQWGEKVEKIFFFCQCFRSRTLLKSEIIETVVEYFSIHFNWKVIIKSCDCFRVHVLAGIAADFVCMESFL